MCIHWYRSLAEVVKEREPTFASSVCSSSSSNNNNKTTTTLSSSLSSWTTKKTKQEQQKLQQQQQHEYLGLSGIVATLTSSSLETTSAPLGTTEATARADTEYRRPLPSGSGSLEKLKVSWKRNIFIGKCSMWFYLGTCLSATSRHKVCLPAEELPRCGNLLLW